jgi:tRNA-dihydrouridine synthase B
MLAAPPVPWQSLLRPVQVGRLTLAHNVFAAPMAGVTDRPYRKLAKQLGAAYAVSEMVTAKRELWDSLKTSRRADHTGEVAPIAVQIAGTDPAEMADAAIYNVERGAQIIDINMGCPAKKVCKVWAGSALMGNETLALRIVDAVVAACSPRGVPVTLKMRTGTCHTQRNAVALARAAQDAGIAMLAIHGRTREQGYGGQAEYDTIAEVKTHLQIPLVANGDITSPEKAAAVLRHTGADAVMIGRAAQGRPWIFREVSHYLSTGHRLPAPSYADILAWLLGHLAEHHALYGDYIGVRSARKHIGWYVQALPGGSAFRAQMNELDTPQAQFRAVANYFDALMGEPFPLAA